MQTGLALDVDGIILDFYAHMCRSFGRPQTSLSDTWSTDWIDDNLKNIWDNKVFWKTLPPIIQPSALTFDFDIYLSSFNPDMINERRVNLLNLGFPNKALVASMDKVDYMKKAGLKYLIDDKPKTVQAVRDAGLKASLVIPFYYSNEYVDKYKHMNPVRNIDDAYKQLKNG